MNDSELSDLLSQVRVPERSSEDWKKLRENTLRQLGRTHSPASNAGRPPSRRHVITLWGVGFVTASLLLGFFIGQWHSNRQSHRREIADAQKLLFELRALFPDQLEAVILTERGPSLILAEHPLSGELTPVFVRVCGAKGCESVVTFSGRQVPLQGAMCEVLLDARGNIIVAGDRFVWTSADPTSGTKGYEIEATTLVGRL